MAHQEVTARSKILNRFRHLHLRKNLSPGGLIALVFLSTMCMDDGGDLFVKDGTSVKFCFHESIREGCDQITHDVEVCFVSI